MPGLFVDRELPIGARSLADDRLEVCDLSARPEHVDDVVDEFEQLDREITHRDLLLLAKVDEARVHPAPHRAPLVLLDETRRVASEADVLIAEDEELRADRLDERSDAERLLDAGRCVADTELDGRVERVRPQVPPDLLPIVDALRLHQELDVVLELVVRGEVRWDAGPREARPDDLPVRLETGLAREPEGTRRGDREQVRQEVARLVHGLDAALAVGDAHVDVQAEDEELADDVLQLLLEHLVALVLGDLLVLPVGERMRARRGDAQAGRAQQRRERAAQLQHLLPRFADVGADLRPHLDDRLHHLGLHAVAEVRPRRGEERVDVALQLPLAVDDLELLLDADRETRHFADPHAVPSMTYVGTTLPAPTVTLKSALDERRVSWPPTVPQKRYESQSIERSRKCM